MPNEKDRFENYRGGVASGALESAQSYVAASTRAGSTGDGGGAEFSRSFGALLEWGVEQNLIRPWESLLFLHVPPDAFGQEHECWFDEENNQWFKATYINRFGLAWGRDGSATANEYLTRLVLQNVHFADSIRLECLINCDQRLRILTTQPHIVGEAADYREIQDWFIKLGFERLKIDDRIAWYHSTENVLVADAHEGNVIKTATGSIVPIDLNIVQPDGAMRDAISELIGK